MRSLLSVGSTWPGALPAVRGDENARGARCGRGASERELACNEGREVSVKLAAWLVIGVAAYVLGYRGFRPSICAPVKLESIPPALRDWLQANIPARELPTRIAHARQAMRYVAYAWPLVVVCLIIIHVLGFFRDALGPYTPEATDEPSDEPEDPGAPGAAA